ncbi:uncharacterized protein A1O9_11480 [Exophiala aquamarina CBS 119918]|uniref:Cytochrome P450 n=1 Tax=Exophiala aquamarina CBS 119918 TaxID=1182545 RepID=A0A072NYY7_9EURO|nr:uncharacterized protein A1O9_11480 [Exophiala aquamarina CBS 119918]KEF52637.1 hypothetical protein A1O9_11480 [Exophiala aquamarina CBS 119918]
MSEFLLKLWLLASSIIMIASAVSYYFNRSSKQPLTGIPWLNTKEGELFTILRSRFRSLANFKQTIDAAYEKYSKQELSCILPSLADATILLPVSHITWLINQPETVLSATEPHVEQLQTQFTFVHPWIVQNPVHHDVITTELTRRISSLTTPIMEEIAAAFDELWGTDTVVWKDVCVFDTIMQVVARASNRAFVGLPLCRNQALLDHAKGFAQAVPLAAVVLCQLPAVIRPVAASFIAHPNRKHTRGFAKILHPEIERRKRLLDAPNGKVEKKIGDAESNDFLQWSLARARSNSQRAEYDSDIIAERLLALNFAAIHTSTFSMTNVIFDLLAATSSQDYLYQLRHEANTARESNNGVWTKKGLSKMYKMDSALRESTRLGSFLGKGLVRKVMVPHGLTTPNGTHCPYGSMIAVPSNGVHNDPEYYPDAAVFRPFRFSSERLSNGTEEDDVSSEDERTHSDGYIRKANLSFVSTSPSYHPFGHGRHACPGRFFAANELKLMLSYMLLNYEFESLGERPESKWIGSSLVPPMNATIKIRRKAFTS